MDKIDANAHYNPPVADPLDPITFVHNIKVPTFMACQWEDEQTGGHCRDLVQHFTGSKRKWFTFTNGAHVDSLDPYTFDRWYYFLELFVAHQAPIINRAVIRAAAPEIYQSAMGLPQDDAATLPVDPIQLKPTYQSALKAFDALPDVRVLFDNGGGTSPTGSTTAGDPYPGFERSFSSLPVPGTTVRGWYLGPGGTLNARPSARRGINWYTSNAKATRSAPAPFTCGCGPRHRTWICRQRSARCDRTETRRSCRTGGSRPTSAGSRRRRRHRRTTSTSDQGARRQGDQLGRDDPRQVVVPTFPALRSAAPWFDQAWKLNEFEPID